MKFPRIDFTYFLYIGAIAAVLSCMMLLTCESCNDFYGSGNVRDAKGDKVSSDTTSFNTDSILSDSISEQKDSLDEDNADSEASADSSNVDGNNGLTEEQIFIKEHFVEVKSVIPDVILDIRYNSSHNFVGRKINGYEESVALLTKEAAEALKEAADDFRSKGYRIKIFDAYRPSQAVSHFRSWISNLGDTLTKDEFYPEKDKSVLFKEGFLSSTSRHCHGSTIDLTLCTSGGSEVDMGGNFDLFSERSHSDYTETLTSTQISNRSLLRHIMEKHGFVVAKTEWWHFRLSDEPFPDKSFSFKVASLSRLVGDTEASPAIASTKTKNRRPAKKHRRR